MPPSNEPPPAPRANLRRHPRYELYASVELHWGDETLVLPARNLSLGGIYLSADGHDLDTFALGSSVEVLVFDVIDESRPAVRAVGEVVRHDESGMALKWKEDPALKSAIESLLSRL